MSLKYGTCTAHRVTLDTIRKAISSAKTCNSSTWFQSKLLHVYFNVILTKIVLCSNFFWTKFINYKCLDMRSSVSSIWNWNESIHDENPLIATFENQWNTNSNLLEDSICVSIKTWPFGSFDSQYVAFQDDPFRCSSGEWCRVLNKTSHTEHLHCFGVGILSPIRDRVKIYKYPQKLRIPDSQRPKEAASTRRVTQGQILSQSPTDATSRR